MRDCPTVEGSSIPLIIHRIGAGDCLQRQACNYHKCHRCIFRGKPAAWVPSENAAVVAARGAATGAREVPARTVEMPRPEPAKQPAPQRRKPAAPAKNAGATPRRGNARTAPSPS